MSILRRVIRTGVNATLNRPFRSSRSLFRRLLSISPLFRENMMHKHILTLWCECYLNWCALLLSVSQLSFFSAKKLFHHYFEDRWCTNQRSDIIAFVCNTQTEREPLCAKGVIERASNPVTATCVETYRPNSHAWNKAIDVLQNFGVCNKRNSLVLAAIRAYISFY